MKRETKLALAELMATLFIAGMISYGSWLDPVRAMLVILKLAGHFNKSPIYQF